MGLATKVLDYGCGSGIFVSALRALKKDAVGYEPYMEERSESGLPIYTRIEDVEALGPYDVITLLETIEHLQENEIDAFLQHCQSLLCNSGGVLISAPIEIGPALLLKELNRERRAFAGSAWPTWSHSASEILKASLLGIPARRAYNIKVSHKGFDFRVAVQYLRDREWCVQTISYCPLPIRSWYGNSQVFLWVHRP
jgi:2-polyprenyl-3-methyl-5-hydroxy-6-metoxy-1,4-benzoquinol methylase